MRETLMREIDAAYEAQRARNHAEQARRLAEASAAEPAIGQLVAERARLFRARAREAFQNPRDAGRIGEALSGRVAQIQARLRALLLANGFAADYLQPVYACAACQDTGYVGEPLREHCACYGRAMRERALRAGGAGNGVSPLETFERYDETVFDDRPLTRGTEDTQRRHMARVRAWCEAYADAYPHAERRNALLVGMSGLGKTYLLNCIGNRVFERGGQVLKLTAYQLSERMREAVFEASPEGFALAMETPVLLLDDLGVEPLYNNITLEYLYILLNERLLAGLHTVISTNLMLEELRARYTERVCSRLFDQRNATLVHFMGKDVRIHT